MNNNEEFETTQCGTPIYMSPEIQEGEWVKKNTDLWSLGCIGQDILLP